MKISKDVKVRIFTGFQIDAEKNMALHLLYRWQKAVIICEM